MHQYIHNVIDLFLKKNSYICAVSYTHERDKSNIAFYLSLTNDKFSSDNIFQSR